MKATQTRNYALFVNDVTNRPITENDSTRLRKLEASMKQYGFLPFPLLVRRNGQKLVVIDGQHRLAVAQKLGLSVQYVETDRDDITIADCAAAQSPWNARDYVSSFAAQGKKAYEDLLRFASDHDIPLNMAASLLAGNGAGSDNMRGKLRDGSFVIKAGPYASRVVKLVESVRGQVKWAAHNHSLGAISRFTFVKDFDDERFISKVRSHPHLLKCQATVEAFSEMYEEVYNHASRTRLPLKFLANEAAQKRSAAQPK